MRITEPDPHGLHDPTDLTTQPADPPRFVFTDEGFGHDAGHFRRQCLLDQMMHTHLITTGTAGLINITSA